MDERVLSRFRFEVRDQPEQGDGWCPACGDVCGHVVRISDGVRGKVWDICVIEAEQIAKALLEAVEEAAKR